MHLGWSQLNGNVIFLWRSTNPRHYIVLKTELHLLSFIMPICLHTSFFGLRLSSFLFGSDPIHSLANPVPTMDAQSGADLRWLVET